MSTIGKPVVISVRDLETRFGNVVVHQHLNLEIAAGELVSLVGGSGSGKTMLLRQMVGLMQPTKGRIELFGEPIFGLGHLGDLKLRRRFGMMFQHGALFSAFSAFDNIAFPLRELKCYDEKMIHDLVMLKLALVELLPRHGQLMPAELSGGMVKRVALARALALDPELLLLDEPTSGLDPDRSDRFVRLIRALGEELGLTVVLVTHDLDTMATLSTKIAALADHTILGYGSLSEIARIDHPFIHNFFSSERAVSVIRNAAASTGHASHHDKLAMDMTDGK